MKKTSTVESRHFRLEQLAEGVYAAINSQDGWAICNAGIIDLGDRILVYDTFISPEAASDLRDAAENLSGRPVHTVINSHYHNDHIWGNQAFGPEVDIVSTAKTRELIVTEGSLEIQWSRDTTAKSLEKLEAQAAIETDEAKLAQLRPVYTYYQAILAALPVVQLRLPNLTFTGDMTFQGSERSARLICYTGGHCSSDAMLYLPEDGVIFMEDILFVGCHPYLADGDPEIIQHILAEVRKLEARIFVPGHGAVGKLADLDRLDEYIDTVNDIVHKAIKQGATEEDLEKIAIPEKYQDWIFPSYFQTNLKFVYRKHIGT